MTNDQKFLDSYLLLLKSTVEVYVHGTLESVNVHVRNTLKASLDNTMSMQDNTYQEMTNLGFYKIKNIDKNTICQTLNKVKEA
ncbi:MAG: spore coat protein [Bacilli bacterium]|nr:spore coat protein [Bacilli bacterium]